jgi:hypothetical protein
LKIKGLTLLPVKKGKGNTGNKIFFRARLLPVLPFEKRTGNKLKPFIFNTVTSVTRVT